MTWQPGDDAILARITARDIRRAEELFEAIDGMPLEDVVRVFVASAHALMHRAPNPMTADELVRNVVEQIEDLHRAGQP